MASELIRPAEPLLAARMGAGMRLFTGMGANVTCLMLETVKCARAQRTLVRSRNLRLVHRPCQAGRGRLLSCGICRRDSLRLDRGRHLGCYDLSTSPNGERSACREG